ncbi:phage portal protein [bacterium]|nr:phage portal protein [bacterium]
MITNFNIISHNKKLNLDSDTVSRLLNYDLFRDLYDGNFKTAFAKTYSKICAKYPLDTTTSQTFVELNLFFAMTDFYKNLFTNQGVFINVNGKFQKIWDEIEKNNNFLSVLKEVFVDASRFGNGIFKSSFGKNGVEITSVSPSSWFPVFNKGNINDILGHIIINTLSDFVNGKNYLFKLIEKHRKGSVEYELWSFQNGSYNEKLDVEKELNLPQFDDFSDLWNDFLIFPVKNTSESEQYFGQSDYVRFKSVVEELILTVSQNSKILNRHANPKMTGSNENLEFNPITGKTEFPNKDFIPVGRDGIKAEYITADLQENAVHQHVNSLLQFFYILSKTPPQAYGLDITNNMSGESLRKIFMTSLTKIDDIKQVSFNSAIQNLVKCSMALNHTPINEVKIDWGNPIPEDKSEIIDNSVKRISSGTLSKISAIAELDNLSDFDANIEFQKIINEKNTNN